jgi:hypothetical protein
VFKKEMPYPGEAVAAKRTKKKQHEIARQDSGKQKIEE